ncbi:histidine kinase [Paenibacillus sp. cl6col]|uniref:sensor histidine kinase n=1 Tax=Paenibacillus sp. cl6col TaxID=1761878 RepID=UPI00088EC315|nr:ATP-binding protein [Paenibacillus sp. cl6col]SDG36479.1 histidine kinase [Paenibacillus sp. cl6col]
MKIKLIYKLLAINAIVLILLVAGISIGFSQYTLQLIEENRLMMYQNFLMFQSATGRYLLYTSLAIIPLSIGINWLFTRSIIRPLSGMRKLTERVASGDYTVRAKIRSNDEIGDLARSFNQMGKELERIEQLRRSLVADVAHELRNPLSTVRGYMEAMKDGVLSAKPETLDKCYHEVERLVCLVEDIHRLAVAESDLKAAIPSNPVDLRSVAQEAASRYMPKWEEKAIVFQEDVPSSPVCVMIDKVLALRVFENLFDNAMRYTPNGHSVHLSMQANAKMLRVEVTNTGAEIAPEHLTLLFERFYRVDPSRSRTYGGAGIGLSIVRDIVERAGGRVWATSGNGSVTIHAELPVDS